MGRSWLSIQEQALLVRCGQQEWQYDGKFYRDTILGTQFKPWLDRRDDFVLEEDQDSAQKIPIDGSGIVQK